MGLHTKGNRLTVVKVLQSVKETPDITTIYFPEVPTATPGQYIMVWLPGIDEVPMSISTIGNQSSISIRVVGEATKVLAGLKAGDRIGIRGPFGNGYQITGLRPLLVGGGTGIASLTPLAEKMIKTGIDPMFLIGARTASQLLFKDRLAKILNDHLYISTDDGSEGFCGYASGLTEKLLDEQIFDQIYLCGPEIMMVKIFSYAENHGIPVQASLERLCKCGLGLCGSCAIGSYRVCIDGPVFSSEVLRSVKNEFGKYKMDSSGKKIRLDQ